MAEMRIAVNELTAVRNAPLNPYLLVTPPDCPLTFAFCVGELKHYVEYDWGWRAQWARQQAIHLLLRPIDCMRHGPTGEQLVSTKIRLGTNPSKVVKLFKIAYEWLYKHVPKTTFEELHTLSLVGPDFQVLPASVGSPSYCLVITASPSFDPRNLLYILFGTTQVS